MTVHLTYSKNAVSVYNNLHHYERCELTENWLRNNEET